MGVVLASLVVARSVKTLCRQQNNRHMGAKRFAGQRELGDVVISGPA